MSNIIKKEELSIFAFDNHPNTNKIFEIESLCAPNKVLDAEQCKTENGTNIFIHDRNGGLNQRFKIHVMHDSSCCLEACHTQNKVIDVQFSLAKNGTNIQLWSRNNTKAQLFRIIKTGEDCYTFLSNLNYDYCIDVFRSENKNGTNVQLFKRNFTNAQKFKLIGKNDLKSAVGYALKYSEEPNPKYNYDGKINGTSFCSQCLYAGGEDPSEIWNEKTDCFKNDKLLIKYFTEKGIPWSEDYKIEEIHPGDIVYTKKENNTFSEPVFIIKKLKKGLIYCGNNPNIENKGILKMSEVPGVLETSYLFL